MSRASHIIGIDLGTTNCALAFVRPEEGAGAAVTDFAVPQLVRPGEVASRPLLPSFLYLPGEHELPEGSARLPWGDSPGPIVGEFARWQGSRVPGRLVASAKSWLCHAGVDRSAAILPWGAPAEAAKISPVEASARLLAHLASAWNFAHPEAPLAAQEVVITVPASFDEVARALTVNAARQAGFELFTLVEEPQAAFYDFTSRHSRNLAKVLGETRMVLVVDVGGGTTDFSLIHTALSPEGPLLRRLAVGDHLMLGGDNMDAALARLVEERWASGGRKLAAAQWTQLVQAARAAKESLLGADGAERHPIAIAAEGSRLMGGTLSSEITREEAERVILEGFFPAGGMDEAAIRGARPALRELGLPYAQDPAVTRHLAAFLRRHADAVFAALGDETARTALPRPDAILLNGGVFNSLRIASHLLKVVSSWWPEAPPVRLLPHDSLELAVARGAAHYGLVRRGLGRRIGGGAARAFYVGLAPAKQGAAPRAVCLIPRGHEEGESVELKENPFLLTLGRPVQFPLFSTSADRIDRPGEVVEAGEDFQALPPIHTLFKGAAGKTTAVPVHLRATLTELGTLELWCVSNADEERWRLEFELRASAAAAGAAAITESMPVRYAEAAEIVGRVFGRQGHSSGEKEARQLVRSLETALGAREGWRVPLLRELWGSLFAGAKRRRRTAAHERVFFQLAGYCLRPGFGYPLDEWRCEQTFQLFTEGVSHHSEPPVWSEFWILWRRVAGGLNEARQQQIWHWLKPFLARRVPPSPSKALPLPKGPPPEGLDEMVRAAASLERVEAFEKVELGQWIAARQRQSAAAGGPWAWSLGRLGARELIYGSSHQAVPAPHARGWLILLLDSGLASQDGAAFAASQLARLTGDRSRDLDDETRARTVEALRAARAPESWLKMVTEQVVLEAADEARALGDTLPIGLQMKG